MLLPTVYAQEQWWNLSNIEKGFECIPNEQGLCEFLGDSEDFLDRVTTNARDPNFSQLLLIIILFLGFLVVFIWSRTSD